MAEKIIRGVIELDIMRTVPEDFVRAELMDAHDIPLARKYIHGKGTKVEDESEPDLSKTAK